MPNVTIGFIRNSRFKDKEREMFERVAKKIGVNLVVFNAAKKMDIERMRTRAAKCAIIINDENDYISLELAKTLETMGYLVSELSKTFYYTEDKWLQYLKCVEHGIPVPKTILLSTDLVSAKKELLEFNQWPVVLKRIEGFGGGYVDKADNPNEAVKIMRKFWKKGEDKYPIIAQEFIVSPSYRVLTIAGRVEQTAVKHSHNWKTTGVSAVRFWKFKVDAELRQVLRRLKTITDLAVCGYDFAKRRGHWLLIEMNALPSYTFYDNDYAAVIEKVLKYHKKLALSHKRKSRR